MSVKSRGIPVAWRMVILNVNFLPSLSSSLEGFRVDMNCGGEMYIEEVRQKKK